MSTTADVTDYHAIHTCLRRGGRAIAEAVGTLDVSDRGRVEALQRYWEGYTNEVLSHHTIEDDIFFPALVERAPVAAEHLGRIDEDHHLLDELMAEGHAALTGVVEGAATDRAAHVLGHLDVMMNRHLDFEDAELLPLFASQFEPGRVRPAAQAGDQVAGLREGDVLRHPVHRIVARRRRAPSCSAPPHCRSRCSTG